MAEVEIPRDRYGRPMVVPPKGGKPVPYTRTTTVAGSLDDGTALVAWKLRMAAAGLTLRPDLLLAASDNVTTSWRWTSWLKMQWKQQVLPSRQQLEQPSIH